jgi:hypothetical protein
MSELEGIRGESDRRSCAHERKRYVGDLSAKETTGSWRWRETAGLQLPQVPILSPVRKLKKQGNRGRTHVLGGVAAPPLLC